MVQPVFALSIAPRCVKAPFGFNTVKRVEGLIDLGRQVGRHPRNGLESPRC